MILNVLRLHSSRPFKITATMAALAAIGLIPGGCTTTEAPAANKPAAVATPAAAPVASAPAQVTPIAPITPIVLNTSSLDAILAGAHRTDANRARDAYRNPKETLAFFSVKPTSTVVEVSPGGGWYTEILAPYLRDGGKYVAALPGNQTSRGAMNFKAKLATQPGIYDKAAIMPLAMTSLDIRPQGGADVVLTFRNVHNWVKIGAKPEESVVDAFFKSFFAALKPGGVLGVVEHRAKAGATLEESVKSGYMTEAYVIERATAAGFKLDAKSEINANVKDTKDHKEGVWTLPPGYALGEVDRAKYAAIGESDRMTLRFIKPAQ